MYTYVTSQTCETDVTHVSAFQHRFEETFFMFVHVHETIQICLMHALSCFPLWQAPPQLRDSPSALSTIAVSAAGQAET